MTVVGQGFLAESMTVLVQGLVLQRGLVAPLMASLKAKLRAFESKMATIYSAGYIYILNYDSFSHFC